MTRQSSSTKHTLWNGKLFRFNMKQHWPFVVGAIILLLIVMIIPTVIDLGTVNTRVIGMEHDFATADDISRWVVSQVSEFLRGDSIAAWIALLGLALVAGIVSLRFLNRKVGVNFWHSVPARRETYLINDFLTYGFYTLVAYAVTFGLQMLVLFSAIGTRVTSAQGTGLFLIALKGFGIGLLVYLYVYAVMILASALSGTDFMRLITAGVIALYPIVLHLSILLLMSEFAEHTDWTALFSYDIAGALAPIVRLFTAFNTSYPFYWYTALLVFLWSVFMIAVAVLLYRHRKSENAEQPMLYRIVAGVIKYATMLIATIVCGLLMRYIGGSYVWMVVGFIIGAVVSFMIINAIFAKSAKAIFKDVKGLVIFALMFAVLFVLFPLDVFGIDSHVPVSGIKSAEIRIQGQEYVLEGEEAEEALQLLREAFERFDDLPASNAEESKKTILINYPVTETQTYSLQTTVYRPCSDYTAKTYVTFTAHPYFGYPKTMNVTIGNDDCVNLVSILRRSATWRSAALDRLYMQSEVSLSFPVLSVYTSLFDRNRTEEQIDTLRSLLRKTADTPSGNTVGYLNSDGIYYYLFDSDVEAILYALHTFSCEPMTKDVMPDYNSAKTMDDLYRIASKGLSSVIIYDWENEKSLTVRDPAEMLAMMEQFRTCLSYGTCSSNFDPQKESERYVAIATYWPDVLVKELDYDGDGIIDDSRVLDEFAWYLEALLFALPKDVTLPAGEWVKAQH